jgi:hypothetical protein
MNLAIALYALYRSSVFAEIYEAWKKCEDNVSSLVQRGKRQNAIQIARNDGCSVPDYVKETCTHFLNTMQALTSILDVLSDADRSSATGQFAVKVFESQIIELTKPWAKWWEQNKEKVRLISEMDNERIEFMPLPMDELMNLEAELFTRRFRVLQPIMDLISNMADTRLIEPPMKGGRYRDVGVVPLLQAAVAAGWTMPQLAQRLISLDLDADPTGTPVERRRKESNRLGAAMREWKKRGLSFPVQENP